MPPAASYDRPSDLDDVLHPLFTDPDNRLGYIKIHKCGTNTYAQHFRQRLDWNRSWSTSFRTAGKYQSDPNPEKILVIVRDPYERYISGMIQVGGSQYRPWVAQAILNSPTLYTHERNQHVWPYTWFLSEWLRFEDRFEFVDIHNVEDWLIANDLPIPPPGQRHRNINPREDAQRLRAEIEADGLAATRIKEYYAHDYALLKGHGLEYDV